MKALRNTTSVVLAVLMLLSVFAAVQVSADTIETISSIRITGVFEPSADKTPDTNARNNTSGCDISHISWYDYANSKWMQSDDTFIAGNEYEVNINIQASEGYSFIDYTEITATINGKAVSAGKVTMEDPAEFVNLSLKFTAKAKNTALTSVNVNGISAPVAGQLPVYTYDENPYYSVTAFEWRLPNDYIQSKNSVFDANTTYTARLYLEPKDGYEFSDSIKANVNGEEAKVNAISGSNKYERICVNYSFTTGDIPETVPFQFITNVDFTDVSAPVAGEEAVFTFKSSDGFTVKNNKVDWYCYADSYTLKAGDKFEAGKTYSAYFMITVKEGYKFSVDAGSTSDVTATVNGNYAETQTLGDYNPGETIRIRYDFPALPQKSEGGKISNIAVTGVDAPEIGKTANTNASASEGFDIESVSWYNKTDGYFMMLGSDKFAADKTYSARIKVTAKDGYAFDNPTASINGKSSNISTVTGYDKTACLLISCDFSTTSEPVETTTAPEETTKAPEEPTTAPEETTAPQETTEPAEHTHNWGEWIVKKAATMDEDGEMIRECFDDPSHIETKVIDKVDTVSIEKWKVSYTGKAVKPAVTVKDSAGKDLQIEKDYIINYPNAVNAGEYVVDVEFIGMYEGLGSTTFIIAPAKNPVKFTAKTKTVKIKALKKKAVTTKPLTIKNAKGTITVAKVKNGTSSKIYKKFTVVKKTGAIKLKKGKYKKGTYKIKLKITVKGGKNYANKTVTKTVKIKIK